MASLRKRARRGYAAAHRQFGTAGLIVSVFAIVLALTGGAFAAAGKLTSKQKKEVTKIAKKYAVKYAGKPGAPGPAGPQGAKGDTGAQGAKGDTGNTGGAGAAGKSVVTATLNPGQGGCAEGGVSVEVEGSGVTKSVCNGEAGTFDPSGLTQTGVWLGPEEEFGLFGVAEGTVGTVPISFPIPLESAPDLVLVKSGQDKSAEGCAGEINGAGDLVGGVAVADPGTLCLYVTMGFEFTEFLSVSAIDPTQDLAISPTPGAGTAGALLKLECSGSEFGYCGAGGVWAVTG